jgi:2-polyprenyl-3-methyl-5-hydroxy-6-metoxy-1,4-benzoquinol methylase
MPFRTLLRRLRPSPPTAVSAPGLQPAPRGASDDERAALVDAAAARVLAVLAGRTQAGGQPNLAPGHLLLREHANLASAVKVFGTELAERLWAEAAPGAVPAGPVRAELGGRLCRQADIESPWLRHWAERARMTPLYHRKVWEIAFILQAIWESGLATTGRSALGFAVGQEPIPAVLAAQGMAVTASDLPPQDPRAQVWRDSSQNAAELRALARPAILSEADFRARCSFRHLDMTAIPASLQGRFDVVWSGCALEHLGSIAAGLDFIEAAMACLKPGGLAVHTTEFNLAEGEETIDNWPTVLFRRRDIEAGVARLQAAGHTVLPVDFAAGGGLLDGYVDLPPFLPIDIFSPRRRAAPHLRLSIDGFPATSIGLIIRARA